MNLKINKNFAGAETATYSYNHPSRVCCRLESGVPGVHDLRYCSHVSNFGRPVAAVEGLARVGPPTALLWSGVGMVIRTARRVDGI